MLKAGQMRLLAILLTSLCVLALPAQASANSCNAFSPFVVSAYDLATSCKLVVYMPDGYALDTTSLQTEKDGVYGTYDAPFTRASVDLDVVFIEWDDACVESSRTSQRTYWRYELDVSTVPVGTEVRTPGGAALITAEGMCTESELPFLYCQEPIQNTCWGTDPVDEDPRTDEAEACGCNAGGSAGGATVLGLLALGFARRRRARR
ncbi:MAG: hypothetical protein M3680_25975 [Myxococcota bacterium]|nr:hypothetical protein [Myxococcota bacterium]